MTSQMLQTTVRSVTNSGSICGNLDNKLKSFVTKIRKKVSIFYFLPNSSLDCYFNIYRYELSQYKCTQYEFSFKELRKKWKKGGGGEHRADDFNM